MAASDQFRRTAATKNTSHLGAALARLEGEVTLSTLFSCFPGLGLAGEPTYGQHAFLRKISSLPVHLAP